MRKMITTLVAMLVLITSQAGELFVKRTRISADQIAGIMNEFTFDDSRLKFAKEAYVSCYDQINYYKLDDAFTFSSNADNLHKFIANK